MDKVGYSALKEMYDLPDVPHHVSSWIVAGARKTADYKEYYPPVYAPENTLAGHLEFALKYEGVNLGLLAELFMVVSTDELTSYVQSKPNGINTRRTWFFYEFLTGKQLNTQALVSTVGYVDALDPNRYVTRTGTRMKRYRVRNNLLGNEQFCPVVRKTEVLEPFSWEVLRDRAADLVRSYDAEIGLTCKFY